MVNARTPPICKKLDWFPSLIKLHFRYAYFKKYADKLLKGENQSSKKPHFERKNTLSDSVHLYAHGRKLFHKLQKAAKPNNL